MSGWLARHWTIVRWLPALAWMGVIFLLSSQSGLRVSEDAAVDKPIRLVAHMASYALLAGLLFYALCGAGRPTARGAGRPTARGVGRPTARAATLALVLATLYAVSDELHQAMVPDRTGRPEDVVIDVVGATIGLVIAAFILGSGDS
ncbi:MAG TPA: VanZ family protein [Candidatus Limnocylindrales bacterium]|nr:VanZ family protein [Candidatus Limnocylindrales bacterium]